MLCVGLPVHFFFLIDFGLDRCPVVPELQDFPPPHTAKYRSEKKTIVGLKKPFLEIRKTRFWACVVLCFCVRLTSFSQYVMIPFKTLVKSPTHPTPPTVAQYLRRIQQTRQRENYSSPLQRIPQIKLPPRTTTPHCALLPLGSRRRRMPEREIVRYAARALALLLEFTRTCCH